MKFKRPDAIAEIMSAVAQHLPQATAAFLELVSVSPGDRGPLLERLRQIKADADSEYVSLLRKVTSTFVTPFDREDL